MKKSLILMVFRRYRKIMISLVMIAALAIALLNGMYNAWQSLDLSLKDYLTEYGIADAVIYTDVASEEVAEKVREMDGVARVTARLAGSSQIITPDGNLLTAQFISTEDDEILKMYSWETEMPPTDEYVLADHWYAKHNGLKAGDVIQIRTGEKEYRKFTVAGIISAPETLGRTKLTNGGRFYPDFGFLYAPISLLKEETEREIARRTEEWKQKEQELIKAQEELQTAWDDGQEQLGEAWNELVRQENEFNTKQTELKENIRQLTEGRVQLTLGRKKLQDAGSTAEEKQEQLEPLMETTIQQLMQLQNREADLAEIRNDLTGLAVRMEEAKFKLIEAREVITSREGEVRSTLGTLRRARLLWEQAQTIDRSEIEQKAPGTIESIESTLAEYGINASQLDDWIGKAESAMSQLEIGRKQIQDGIARINLEYLSQIQSNLDETETALDTVASINDEYQKTIASMENGLKTIAEFRNDAPDSKAEIDKNLKNIEEGLDAIYTGLEEGEKALSQGREELENKSAEAEEKHTKAEADLAEGSKKLEEAWKELTAWEGYTPMRNEFLIWFKDDVTDQRATLKAITEGLNVKILNSELYDDSQVAEIINDNMTPMWAMSVLVPLLFAAIMLVVLLLFLSIMIRQSRKSIGILRALGFTKGQVRGMFSLSCVALMIVAAFLGGLFSLVITKGFNMYYQEYFSLPAYVHSFSVPVFAVSMAAFALLAFAAVSLTSGSLSRIQPAEAVSQVVSTAPKIGPMTRKLLRKVKPLSKFSLLSLRRNPFRFITSVICISGAVSIIFAAFSFITSKNAVIDEVFGHQILYDAQVIFAKEPKESAEDTLREISAVKKASRYWSRSEDLSYEGKSVRASLMFMEPGNDMIMLTDAKGQPMDYPTEGIVLSTNVAQALGVQTGDTVMAGNTEVVVAGTSRQMALECQFLPAAERERFREAEQTGWLIRLQEGADKNAITEGLYKEEGYAATLWRSLMFEGFSELFDSFDLFTWMLVILCGFVAVFIVVNTARNNLLEQQLSLSVLRAIGFQHSQISARWFLQSLLFLICSLAIGFVLGQATAVKSLELLSNSARHFEYVSSFFQYAWTTICTFVFLLIGHLISVRTMKKWDLVENVKGRE